MLFNTLAFAKFFVFVFSVSWLLSRWPRARFGFLATMSYVFYAGLDVFSAKFLGGIRDQGFVAALKASAPHLMFVPIVFIGSTVDYWLSVWLAKTEDPKKRKRALLVTIVMNTTVLLVFKYYNFVLDQLEGLAHLVHLPFPNLHLHIPLPIGISFFTFMSLSYVIDVYRRTIPPCEDYVHYVTYICFFPHLVAGPIIRGKDLLPLFARPVALTSAAAGEGMFLMAAGLFKKVVISDYLALNLVDRVVAEPTSYSSVEVLTAMFGYAIQVYCDFSGYSDVAIGAALLLGYRFKINFDAPYKSSNVAEFWRRWHISLSSWLRDYVYIPLGGGRVSKARKYLNLWITMVVCGIWHGAAWSFVIFGMVQGFAVLLTHAWFESKGQRPDEGSDELTLGRVGATLATFFFISLSFVLIRAPIDKAILMYRQLFAFTTFTPNLHRTIVLVIAGGVLLQWFPRRIFEQVRQGFIRAPAIVQALALFGVALALREAASTEAVPFVYFQF
jgi:D-alanyl-lipoteichoic acid acyltransferase DltB (MBOAT superfamily)